MDSFLRSLLPVIEISASNNVLPGHIELIALIFVINLPLLFASTALAPISFMPNWLGWLASLNPLTFAIEPIRIAYTQTMNLDVVALHAPYGCLLYTSPSPRDVEESRMPSSA